MHYASHLFWMLLEFLLHVQACLAYQNSCVWDRKHIVHRMTYKGSYKHPHHSLQGLIFFFSCNHSFLMRRLTPHQMKHYEHDMIMQAKLESLSFHINNFFIDVLWNGEESCCFTGTLWGLFTNAHFCSCAPWHCLWHCLAVSSWKGMLLTAMGLVILHM